MEYKGSDYYCDVALKNTSSLTKAYESEHVLAYHHTRPYWPVHMVVVPKKHISSFTDRDDNDDAIMKELLEVVRSVAKDVEQKEGAARILTNLGTYQDSKHLHFHICSGEPLR
jgi:histidine triad (HIT) family protein